MSGDPDESRIIAQVLRHCPTDGRHRPPPHPSAWAGDDAAVVAPGVVVTVDAMVEGIHWDARISPEDVGWKLVAVNVSDVAAMGCRPTWAVLALSMPSPPDAAWVEAFSRGLGAALRHYGAVLVGGDTTGSPGPISLGLTLAGAGPAPVPRSGGRAGDRLWVTGELGETAAGFFDAHPAGLARLRRPDPPAELGAAIGDEGLAHAMMDLSDGLLRDLPRLCEASGLGARIDAEALPAGPAVASLPPEQRLRRQVAFGEDYELLIAAPDSATPRLQVLARTHGRRLTAIGRLTAESPVLLDGAQWPRPDFEHFRPSTAPVQP